MLERSVPFYIQIARILRRELADGVYPVASRMPDELALASRFGVSKDVIRVSMRLLAKEKLVKPIRSRGTFVCEQASGIGSSYVLMSFHGALHLAEIRRGIDRVMSPRGNLVLKKNALDDLEIERQVLDTINFQEVRALIASPAYCGFEDNTEAYARVLNSGVPLLIIDHSLPKLPADEISFDEYGASVRLFREAMLRIGNRPVLMFVENNPTYPIESLRSKAMLDVWKEFGGSSETRRLCLYDSPQIEFYKDETRSMWEAMGQCDFDNYAIIGRSVALNWELCNILRETGREKAVFMYSGIGDFYRGDEEFNSKVYAHYRLFDEFAPLIAEVLQARLSGENAPSTPIRKKIGFREMTGEQMRCYIQEKLSIR